MATWSFCNRVKHFVLVSIIESTLLMLFNRNDSINSMKLLLWREKKETIALIRGGIFPLQMIVLSATCIERNNNKAILLDGLILRTMKRAKQKHDMNWPILAFVCQFFLVHPASHSATVNVSQSDFIRIHIPKQHTLRVHTNVQQTSVHNKCKIESPFATVSMASADFPRNECLWWPQII